jgi:site-specific DNA-adenine methylase
LCEVFSHRNDHDIHAGDADSTKVFFVRYAQAHPDLDAVFYLDPPYHPDTRGRDRRNAYRHDLDAAAHERRMQVIRRYAVAFLERHLAGREDTLLDGQAAAFPEVQVERWPVG